MPGAPRSTERSWGAQTSCNGMAITRCSTKRSSSRAWPTSYGGGMERLTRWAGRHPRLNDPQLWIEAFVVFNLACLALDIYLAHSTNEFRRQSEYIPLYFSLAAPIILLVGLLARERFGYAAVWRDLGYLVGWCAIVIGITGVVLHLDSRFFYERTVKSLTYAAPFAAPLAYTGVGLLLLLNRMVAADSVAWAYWLLLLALGGFAGNFIFSLT